MKRLMEEVRAQHVEVVHYSSLPGIKVGREARGREEELKFWAPIVGSLSNVKIKKDEVDQAEKRI